MPIQNQAHARCGAKTRSGEPCKNYAMANGRCRMHGGKSTGPKNQRKNKNAQKHGLFSKHLPEDTKDLLEDIEGISPIDILWGNIQIQYAAIIRAQRIMYVKSQEDLVKMLRRKKESDHSTEVEYELQFSWDRQERFLQSQSRAMTSLPNMIMKYEQLCQSELATTEQQLRIEKLKVDMDKTKAEIDKLKGISEEIEDLEDIFGEIYEEA